MAEYWNVKALPVNRSDLLSVGRAGRSAFQGGASPEKLSELKLQRKLANSGLIGLRCLDGAEARNKRWTAVQIGKGRRIEKIEHLKSEFKL